MVYIKRLKNIFIPLPPSSGGSIINECESIRGWAITLVFFFHLVGSVYGYSANAETPVLRCFIISWNMGVTLFFVLSGYLLSLPFCGDRVPKLKVFYRNRFLRIMPLYTTFVFAGALINSDFRQGLKALLFIDLGVAKLWPFGAVWWSLGVEVQYYIIMPLIMLLIFSKKLNAFYRPAKYILIFLISTAAIYAYWKASKMGNQASVYTILNLKNNIAGRWPNFFCGMMLAIIQTRYGTDLKSYLNGKKISKYFTGDILIILTSAVIFFYSIYIVRLYGIARHAFYYHHYAIEGLLFTLLLFILFNFKLRTRVILVNPVMNFLGLLSYSIYLLHVPVMNYTIFKITMFHADVLKNDPIRLLYLSGQCIVITIVLSMFTYAIIERQFLKLKA